jgi:hypothetical protein
MRTYQCSCGNRIFSENVQCMACHAELGFCPHCRNLVALIPQQNGLYQCGNASCGGELEKCSNYTTHHVCNRCLAPATAADDNQTAERLCDCCRFNTTIPDLTVDGNHKKWAALESAKRRLFYDLGLLGLPYGTKADGIEPSLAFAFKADVQPDQPWLAAGETEKVYTSHSSGLITINLLEADPVEREKLRVGMREAHRTLIGHFRHEIGHFYWDVLVKGQREAECAAVFGDHNNPTYQDALATYYQTGPRPDWRQYFVSAYATMHPWEDFAETWAVYLDITSTLETAANVGFPGQTDPAQADLDHMVRRLQELALSLNEINRNQGLPDVVPEVLGPPVVEKLRYIHQLVQAGRSINGALQPPQVTETYSHTPIPPNALPAPA